MEIKLSFVVGGITFGVDSMDQLQELATNAPDIFKMKSEVDQAAIAVGVLTAKTSSATPDVPVNKSKAPGDVPSCDHGVMTDLRGKTYQSGDKKGQPYPESFYCNAPKGTPFAEKCKPRS